MTITKSSLRSAVAAYKKENAKANKNKELYAGQRSSLYQLIVDDFTATKSKTKVSKNRKNRASLKDIPTYSAPIKFTQETSRVPFLWECKMHPVTSSFINAVGYCKEEQVLKILMNNTYLYAYQGVPESAFTVFLNTNSVGSYYNRFARNYAGVRLA